MSFNSLVFIFLFFPATLVIYYFLGGLVHRTWCRLWLIAASLVFYGYAGINCVLFLIASVLINYAAGRGITYFAEQRSDQLYPKFIALFGISINIGLLAYFKYYNFLAINVNSLIHTHIGLDKSLGILGISFITFQQVAYLVDVYRGKIKTNGFLEYLWFATFFPKLINGPIARFQEIVPQFRQGTIRFSNYENLSKGLFIFVLGLFKKAVIADNLAVLTASGFNATAPLSMMEGWITSLSYTFQIYFDFSGYTDMAIGAALMFNIALPFNFNSPYKALSIRDFWGRWHITLTRFLIDTIYIPLGGNRKGEAATLRNIMLTFLISGLWHGASWTFVFWGFLHGTAMIVHRLWRQLDLKLPDWAAWLITFNFVNVAWVFFRAELWQDAVKVLKAMAGFSSVFGWSTLADLGAVNLMQCLGVFFMAALIASWVWNSNKYSVQLIPSGNKLAFLVTALIVSLLFLNSGLPKNFIYNDF